MLLPGGFVDRWEDLQQQARAGLDMMTRDIRLAGYDPEYKDDFGILVATSNEFKFEIDWDEDGKLDVDETVHYRVDNGNLKRKGVFGGLLTPNDDSKDVDVAINIDGLEFLYMLDDGTQKLDPKGLELNRIRGVTITMLARVDKDDDSFTNNMTYTTAGNQSWGAKGDGHRRRLFTTTVKCRNLGIKL